MVHNGEQKKTGSPASRHNVTKTLQTNIPAAENSACHLHLIAWFPPFSLPPLHASLPQY